MIEKGWGRVINTGSMHALVASPFKSAYVFISHQSLPCFPAERVFKSLNCTCESDETRLHAGTIHRTKNSAKKNQMKKTGTTPQSTASPALLRRQPWRRRAPA